LKDQAQLIILFNKYLSSECSLEEVEELMQYFSSRHRDVLEERILNEFECLEFQQEGNIALPPKVFEGIKARIATVKASSVQRRLWPRIAVAAAIAMVVFGAGLFYINQKSLGNAQLVVYQKDIEPAGNKAYLTLANGKRIALNDAIIGNIATQSNIQVSKTADGRLVYTAAENSSTTNLTIAYNTIETPNGGKYEIMLPDGTHVWMNAGSKLKYPVSFASLKERRIELQGEAYFQVTHNKAMPFRVFSLGQTVEVLGTHFNITAYSDESVVRTTLLEGSVKVTQSNTQDFKLLKPGEQASLQNDRLQISEADTEQAVAWKNGEFVFAGEDLKALMRQVARWYDVDVEYKGNVNVNGIFSAFPRTMKLSQLLKALEANQGIHFKMEGRRVLVMP
jgi:ferric-dicitrate binding protein FerR (iron transport regulator)